MRAMRLVAKFPPVRYRAPKIVEVGVDEIAAAHSSGLLKTLGFAILLMAALSGVIGWFVSDPGAVLGPMAY